MLYLTRPQPNTLRASNLFSIISIFIFITFIVVHGYLYFYIFKKSNYELHHVDVYGSLV